MLFDENASESSDKLLYCSFIFGSNNFSISAVLMFFASKYIGKYPFSSSFLNANFKRAVFPCCSSPKTR